VPLQNESDCSSSFVWTACIIGCYGAKEHNLFVIEDNAQAIGAIVFSDGTKHKAGTIGHTDFVFPSKNLGCYGDGGAIFTMMIFGSYASRNSKSRNVRALPSRCGR
jgi:hypothetical protein